MNTTTTSSITAGGYQPANQSTPLLRGGTTRTCLTDEPDDVCQCRVARGFGSLYLKCAVAVNCAGVHVVIGVLGDRHAFAGDCRLVHAARSADDVPVERNAFTGLDDNVRPYRHIGNRYLATSRLFFQKRRWQRQIQQGFDRAPSATDTPRFKKKREGKKRGNRRGFKPLADDYRAGDIHAHVQVHVRSQRARGMPRLGQHKPQARRDGQGVENSWDDWRFMSDIHSSDPITDIKLCAATAWEMNAATVSVQLATVRINRPRPASVCRLRTRCFPAIFPRACPSGAPRR